MLVASLLFGRLPSGALRRGMAGSALQVQSQLDSNLAFGLDRKTKIVATIGPACQGRLPAMLLAGMNVARINCAHGSAEQYAEIVAAVRAAEVAVATQHAAAIAAGGREGDLSPHSTVQLAGSRSPIAAIAFDIKGPEIRTGRFDATVPATIIDGRPGPKEVPLAVGQVITLTTAESSREAGRGGEATQVFVSYPAVVSKVRVGQMIFVDDGNVELEVRSVDKANGTLSCVSKTAAPLGERKNVNLPDVFVDLPAVTAKDVVDIATAKRCGADFLFASFVQSADAVRQIRKLAGPSIRIISKIENQAGLDNYDEILSASDGIMVARGDLGVQIPGERVFLAQKAMIARANIKGKMIICATQMLDSMMTHPRPTRAEIVDVASACLDGADAVMLSGETAKGKFPLEAVKVMSRTCQAAEASYDSAGFFSALCGSSQTPTSVDNDEAFLLHETLAVREWLGGRGHEGEGVADVESDAPMTQADVESLASSAVHAAFEVGAPAIVCLTNSGRTAALVAKYRPKCPVLCLTSNPETAKQLQLRRGCQTIMVEPDMTIRALRAIAGKLVKDLGLGKQGDKLVVVACSDGDISSAATSVSLMHIR